MRRSARRSRRICPRAGQDPPGKGPLIFEARRRGGLPSRGRLGRLQERDGQIVGFALGQHPGEAITLPADERVLGPREQALESEPALFVGQGLERPGAVAAIEDRGAGDGLAVGANHATGDVAVEPGQDDRAEVVGFAGVADDLRASRSCSGPEPRRRPCTDHPARDPGRRTSPPGTSCTIPARSPIPWPRASARPLT